MYLTKLAALLLYWIENRTGFQHYRSPEFQGIDVLVPYDEVVYWEAMLRWIFEMGCYERDFERSRLYFDSLKWLHYLAEDDVNNRDDDDLIIIGHLKLWGFLDNDGFIVSDAVQAILLDVIHVRGFDRGLSLKFRLSKVK